LSLLGELAKGYLATHEASPATAEAFVSLGVASEPFDRDAPLHITGSALAVHLPSRRVLLRFHERVGSWIQLGGHGEAGEEDPFVVARRESIEESGLLDLRAPDPAAPRLVQVVLVEVGASGREPAHQHLDLRYLLLTEQPESARPESPSAPLRWVEVDDAPAHAREENLLPLFGAAATLCNGAGR
jgi:8-oxo-dGTP pyrophosphatase MutT (NUDIX family)